MKSYVHVDILKNLCQFNITKMSTDLTSDLRHLRDQPVVFVCFE